MIYDPCDVNMAMDNHGHLYYRGAPPDDQTVRQVGEHDIWVRYEEIDFRGEFRRPQW